MILYDLYTCILNNVSYDSYQVYLKFGAENI